MGRVYARRRADGSVTSYGVEYRDETRRLVRKAGFYRKEAAQAALAEKQQRVRDIRDGLRTPMHDELARPILEHVADYATYLEARGDSVQHVRETASLIRRTVAACGWGRFIDVTGAAVAGVLSDAMHAGRSRRTCNKRLTALRGWCTWMVRERRAAENPLAHLARMDTRLDRRRVRRALDAEELARLIAAAEASPQTVGGLDGPERSRLYRFALETGFRANECRSVTAGDCACDGPRPFVRLAAQASKRRRAEEQPITPAFAAELRTFTACGTRSSPTWPGRACIPASPSSSPDIRRST